MNAAQRYYAAQAYLIGLERTGLADESVTDPIREEMDRLWLDMSEEERTRSRQLAPVIVGVCPDGCGGLRFSDGMQTHRYDCASLESDEPIS